MPLLLHWFSTVDVIVSVLVITVIVIGMASFVTFIVIVSVGLALVIVVVIVSITGVCKINGVVIVVNCCYSTGFSTTMNNKSTVYFANTGIMVAFVMFFLLPLSF